ncbi:WYL domain-containing protein [Pseudomonas stutzeri]|uniref:WYL domain-containing protein n=1 Tax=Stutzerimonas stutzeri TaxID=316 RepID=A0A2N8RYK3_STUST|nr:WYL domain-containing protein [Stutzerimonas stutzeri]MCQ4295956.1 WYL domain-containing protein [Stutzerimonas stutzeri]PNF79443.1 WYL domain-containing protein [Stutzerimonas stutzeri]
MAEAKDTLHRQLSLLRLIPEYPRYTSSQTLRDKLHERGFKVDLRTVQRDLNRLSIPFSLISQNISGRNEWSHAEGAPLDLRDMDPATALALHLAESHLKSLLPQSMLDLLGPQFKRARNYLDNLNQNDLAHWARRVRAHPNGKALLPAHIETGVWQAVSSALLERRQLKVDYLSRSTAKRKELLLHPAGLISRHSISYLIANVNGYDDLRQFALHRIQNAECLDAAAQQTESLDLDHYIRFGGFNSSSPVEEVELVADVSQQIAWLLRETPLSHEQNLEPLAGSDWQRLRAKVPDDQETLWWVFGLAENVRVHEPKSWAQTIREKTARLTALYAD